jgi:hypothetical protein
MSDQTSLVIPTLIPLLLTERPPERQHVASGRPLSYQVLSSRTVRWSEVKDLHGIDDAHDPSIMNQATAAGGHKQVVHNGSLGRA